MPISSLAVALVLLSGCWRTDEPVSYSTIYLENPSLEAETMVQTYTTQLSCPGSRDAADTEAARFYAVYRSDIQPDPPVAIVFHSGAFDYVVNPRAANPLEGDHFRSTTGTWAADRLSRSWASERVFSTLGMGDPEVDPGETHTGTLAAWLANRGVLALYPANCWGDLWHNEQGSMAENDYGGDYFYRNGRTFAWWMVAGLTGLVNVKVVDENGETSDFTPPVPVTVDPANALPILSLIGLGDGGRGVGELALRMTDDDLYDASQELLIPPIYSMMVDSSPDALAPYVTGSLAAYDAAGLGRIFYEADLAGNINNYSVNRYLVNAWSSADREDLPEKLLLAWSSGDSQISPDSIQPLVDRVQAIIDLGYGEQFMIQDRVANQHVFTNNDDMLAKQAVSWLFPEGSLQTD